MKVISRIALFIFCLITIFAHVTYADEILSQSTESLEPQFVQIEASNENSVTLSIFQTVQNVTQVIQARFYSLLNWRSHSRRANLEIENYNRVGQFGRWINDPKDEACLNTRAKVLLRDSSKNVIFKENNRCVVSAGAWKDPYTAKVFNLANDIQIDHLVPLKNAYMSGAHKWSFKARCLYANYLGYDFHLLSVLGVENMKKSDKAPDKYMPPQTSYACTYIRNWLAVKMLWGLSMTVNEATAIRNMISEQGCSTASFRISEAEFTRHRNYTRENMNLCENVDHSTL